MISEQLPNLVAEQVKAIANLKIDSVTVWDSGKQADGKNSTASFVSGLAGSLPPLHELTRNVGIDLPAFLGKVKDENRERGESEPAARQPGKPKPAAPDGFEDEAGGSTTSGTA